MPEIPPTSIPVQGHPLYRFVHGDITDAALVERVFREHEITSVIHLAAESHVDRSIDDPGRFIKTNVEGTYRLLETARRFWTPGTGHRFVHVSTDEVFGSLDPGIASFLRNDPLRAEQSLRRLEGRWRPPRPGLFPHLRPPGPHLELLE